MEKTLNPIELLLENFCERLSEDQWQLLRSGTPDAATRAQLGELVLGMVTTVSHNVVTALENIKSLNFEEEVAPCVDEVVSQTCSDTLAFPEELDSSSSKCLSVLIETDMRENISTTFSSKTAWIEISQGIIEPSRLNKMVNYASKMFKNFTGKMKSLYLSRRMKRLTESRVNSMDLDEDQEVLNADDGCQISGGSREVSPVESIKSKASESLQEEIKRQLNELVIPLADDLPEDTYEQLQKEMSEEVRSLSDDISDVLCVKNKQRRLLDYTRTKIKCFFTKCMAKVWTSRLVEQLTQKHAKSTHGDSSESVESLARSLTSQLQITDDEDQTAADGFNSNITSLLEFSDKLEDLISHYFKPQLVTELQRMQCMPESCEGIRFDIQSKVWIFVILMNWWLKTQVDSFSEQVNLPKIDDALLLDAEAECKERRDKQNAALVKDVIDKVLHRVFHKGKLDPGDPSELVDQLFNIIWPTLKNANLNMTEKSLENTSKKIYQKLSRKWGNTRNLLYLLNLKNPVVDGCVRAVFVSHLTRPPKHQNVISRFMSSMGKLICSPFRQK